jgi:Na+/melibiose symporter-like transporter
MNLALAAGIALPSLAMLGYVPQGNNSGQSLTYLAAIYALLPCMLKAIAAAALLYSPFARSVAKTGGAVPFAQRVNP